MKSSKIENLLNCDPPLEDTKISPLTYYQPFQSSFDPNFFVPPTKVNTRQQWNQERCFPTAIPTTVANPWDFNKTGTQPQTSTKQLRNFFQRTSGWGETEGRSLCNSSWRNPVQPQSLLTGFEEAQNPVRSLGTHSLHAPKTETVFGGGSSGLSHRAGSSLRQSTSFDGGLHQSTYNPFMFGSMGKNFSPNACKTGHNRPMVCNFCKNNKEVPDIYLNHYLYDPETKVLSCPVLRKHVCEICGGTGDQAHTLQYCPVNKERGLQSKVPVLLKTRTITNSTGKIRRN